MHDDIVDREAQRQRDARQFRGALLMLAVAVAIAAAWIGYSVGNGSSVDRAWERAEQRAVLVQLRGFCASSSAALAAVQDYATGDVEETILLGRVAEQVFEDAQRRFPGRAREAVEGDWTPVERWELVCSELDASGFSILAGIEPDDIRP